MNIKEGYWRVEMLATGLSAGFIARRLSFKRALDICNSVRDSGAAWCVVLGPDRELVVGVFEPESTHELENAAVEKAKWFVNLTESL